MSLLLLEMEYHMKKSAPQSHLTLSDRITIEASLLTNHKARDIARQLKKDPMLLFISNTIGYCNKAGNIVFNLLLLLVNYI